MKDLYRILTALAVVLCMTACQGPTQDSPANVTCETLAASNVSPVSVTLSGRLVTTRPLPSFPQAYFLFSESASTIAAIQQDGEIIRVGAMNPDGGGFSLTRDGLTPGTEYHYAALVECNGEKYIGAVESFTTENPTVKLSCRTGDAADVTFSSAALSGEAQISNLFGRTCTLAFCYSNTISDRDALLSSGSRVVARIHEFDGFRSFSTILDGLEDGTTYYFVAVAEAGGVVASGDVKSFTTPLHVPEGAADLGIVCNYRVKAKEDGTFVGEWSPHRIFLAKCNLGAEKPQEFGDYYAWGEVEPYYEAGYARAESPVWKAGKEAGYSMTSYKWAGEEIEVPFMGIYRVDFTVKKYCPAAIPEMWAGEGQPDNVIELSTGPDGDDIANRILGGEWRIPTYFEWQSIMEQCDVVPATLEGVAGFELRSKAEGNTETVFLPATGYRSEKDLNGYGISGGYLSATLKNGEPCMAETISVDSDGFHRVVSRRCNGFAIRAVTE